MSLTGVRTIPEMTPDQMRERIAELEGTLDNARMDLQIARFFDEGDLTPQEIHDMVHAPRAEPGALERLIKELSREVGIEA